MVAGEVVFGAGGGADAALSINVATPDLEARFFGDIETNWGRILPGAVAVRVVVIAGGATGGREDGRFDTDSGAGGDVWDIDGGSELDGVVVDTAGVHFADGDGEILSGFGLYWGLVSVVVSVTGGLADADFEPPLRVTNGGGIGTARTGQRVGGGVNDVVIANRGGFAGVEGGTSVAGGDLGGVSEIVRNAGGGGRRDGRSDDVAEVVARTICEGDLARSGLGGGVEIGLSGLV